MARSRSDRQNWCGLIGPDQPDHPVATVVGFDARHPLPGAPADHARMIIDRFRQKGLAQGAFVMRTGPAVPSFAAIREAVRSVDPDAVLVESHTMDELIAPQIAQPRLNALLLSAFALVAILLAAIGLYGHHGLRGLPADPRARRPDGARGYSGRSPQHGAGPGADCRGTGSGGRPDRRTRGTRLLKSMLFEVSPGDPITLIGVTVLLLGVALLAAYLRHAGRPGSIPHGRCGQSKGHFRCRSSWIPGGLADWR